MNWIAAFNRLFLLLDKSNTPAYHSGNSFIKVIQQYDREQPSYSLYIKERNNRGLSTSRKDFYWDILIGLDDSVRLEVFRTFIDIISPHFPIETDELKSYLLSSGNPVPQVVVPQDNWNSEKLNTLIKKIDNAIDQQNYNHSMTLSYTCLEGLYKAYVYKHLPQSSQLSELIPLSKLVRDDITTKLNTIGPFPQNMVTSISTLTSAIGNSRNGFSDSHFDNESNKWLASYSRDLVNSIGRLILHFL
ncbi:hypothetical protein ABFV74_01510 [Pseudoalteromonas distincta]|uniref:hypothetical protein n=1 Tax=Pseudoalteromonas distincta TaxID=77608 RepID=UPI003218AF56